MKKIFVLSVALLSVFSLYNPSFAFQAKSSDYVIVPEGQETIVQPRVKPVQVPPLEEMRPLDENNTEFIYKVDDVVGYINTKTAVHLQTDYDNILLMGDYLKVKKDGKYGVIDKEGNIILAPVFQRIGIFNQDGKEYISAKADGKYRLYYNTGKLIPEEKLYSLEQNTSMLLAKDLKPLFKSAVMKNQITYTKSDESAYDDSFVYEIKEIPLPGKVKTTNISENIANTESVSPETHSAVIENNLFTVKKKQYLIIKDADKIGIANVDNEVIIPAKYDAFALQTPCSHFIDPVFIVSRDNAYTIFNQKGKILAEQVYDKINVYRKGKIYTYSVENGVGQLKENDKQLGTITKDGDNYKYKSAGFSIFKPHIVNSLIISMLNVANL